jgi:tetratricopeptide (TPR) repeat protein
MVHRDPSPGNILIGQAGTGEYIAKITDFGLATVAQETGMELADESDASPVSLAKERENRFATLDELLAQLTALYEQLFAHPPKPLAALASFRRAIQLNPSDASAYFNTGALYYNRGQKGKALPYFEKAAQFGDSQAAQIVERIRRELGMAPQENQSQQAFDAFAGAKTLDEMIGAVRQYNNFMIEAYFMILVADVIQK